MQHIEVYDESDQKLMTDWVVIACLIAGLAAGIPILLFMVSASENRTFLDTSPQSALWFWGFGVWMATFLFSGLRYYIQRFRHKKQPK